MAATGFTPISLYYSTTASATPSAGNLVAGELALNTVDEKLYFKNSAGTVKLLASNAATTPVTPGGSTTQIQYNSSGSFAGSSSLTFDGTTLTAPNSVITSSSSSNALRITQTGTGNALLVEDSTNPDSTPFVIDASGNVGIGTSSPSNLLHTYKSVANTYYNIVENPSTTGATTNAGWQFNTYNGTSSTAQGFIYATGNSWTYTTGFANSLNLNGTGAGGINIIASNASGVIKFLTAGDVAGNERMRIDSSGNVGIGTTTPTSAKLTIASTTLPALTLPNIAEISTVSATAATGTINYDLTTQSVLYYTTNASGNFTMNIRGNSGLSLDSMLATGQSVTMAFLCTNGATAYYQSAMTIDGTSVTPKWQGGTAPTTGNASSIDSYVYTIIKTASATFTVLASQTKFA